ncbi:hypothetical protein LCGC14_2385610, partial [marine sediment metagenome]
SLGLGAQQASAGINHVFGLEGGIGSQILVIVGVTLLAVISVIRGIDGGVKLLSNINMLIAFALLVFVCLVGFAVAMGNIPRTFMGYVENIIPLSNPHGREDETWMHGWTVFYWAWWVAYAPCFGMFVARISKGRTIREFLVYVLLIPTLVTTAWMSVFGGIAIDQVINEIGVLGADKGITDVSLSLFYMLDAYSFSTVLSLLAIALIIIFFVTTLDSGSIVIDSLTSGGKLEVPIKQKLVWANIAGIIAMLMLWIGGTESIQALQYITIIAALPFTLILLLGSISLVKGLMTELETHK